VANTNDAPAINNNDLALNFGSILENNSVILSGTSKLPPPGQTVFDDGSPDTLTGGNGRDWFFANYPAQDSLPQRASNETVMALPPVQGTVQRSAVAAAPKSAPAVSLASVSGSLERSNSADHSLATIAGSLADKLLSSKRARQKGSRR